MNARTKKALVLFVGLLGMTLAVEGGARLLTSPPVIKGNQISDRLTGFRHQGNRHLPCSDERGSFDYRLNAEGFRGPELPEAPPRTESRVVILGDSFVNAWGVREEDWVGTRVREELAAAGRESTVHALCADDFGTGQELLLLGEFAPRVEPTEVVLFLFPGNDVINNSIELAGYSNVSPGDYFRPYLERDGAGSFTRRYALPLRAFWRRSRIFDLLETRFLAGRSQDELLRELCPSRMSQKERVQAGLTPMEYLEVFRAPPLDSPWSAAWGHTEDLLLGFAEKAKQLGARFLVVVIPTKIQAEHTGAAEALDLAQRANKQASLEEMLDFNYPESRLEAFLQAKSIDHVLLLDEVRRKSVELCSSLYIQNGHLNGPAHHLMGALVARWVLGTEPGVCFHAGPDSQPVPIERILPPGPLEIDFQGDGRPELQDNGWGVWEQAKANFAGGWPMRELGTILVPSGSPKVTLSGYLAPDGVYPVELVVSSAQKSQRILARQSFDAAGPFALSFSTRENSAASDSTRAESSTNNRWFLVKLSAESERKPISDKPRLRLRALSVAP